jgi:cardiolipin synthase
MFNHPVLLAFGTIVHLTVFTLITLHCLGRRRNAGATILWIAIAWSFPLIGPLLYISFGIDRVADRGFERFLAEERLKKVCDTASSEISWHMSDRAQPESALQSDFNRTLDALLPEHPALSGNQIEPLVTGDEAYPEMLETIRNAQDHIHLQSFIFGRHEVGREFLKTLAEKAEEGVTVRLLYDRFGSTHAHLLGLFRKYKNIPNLQIAGWTQSNWVKKQFQINLRNHRKILVVDGKTAFFGGINLHRDNTSAHAGEPIRDYHFKAHGPMVQELQYSFLKDWYFITSENPENLLSTRYFPRLAPAGTQTARLISSGPSSPKQIATETLFTALGVAEKQILAVSPYFTPPPEILSAFRSAALRGLDVSIVLPKKSNHTYAAYAAQALYADLMEAGVRIYERNPPFMHSKALVIDNELVLVGTANIDERSLNLNYETIAAIYSTQLADTMKEIIHEEMANSCEILLNEWQKRPEHRKLLENLASLMAPVI